MLRVRNAMNRDVITANVDETLDNAYRTMQECQISHLVVVDGDNVRGLISEGDVMLHASLEDTGDILIPPVPLTNVMSEKVISCSPSNTLAEVAATMITCRIGCMPVIQEGKLVGIVTTSDLLDKICEQDELMGYRVMPLDFGVRTHAAAEIAAHRESQSSRDTPDDWGARVYADGYHADDHDLTGFDAERYVQKRLDEDVPGIGEWDEDLDETRVDEHVRWT